MLSRETELVLLALFGVFFALGWLARRYPDVSWLQPFNLGPGLNHEQQATVRRRANTQAGLELILLGLAVPVCYGALTIMLFNEFEAMTTLLVLGVSLVCIALGIAAIVRRGRQ